jgi:signal transduction histidine kinase
MKSSEQLMQTTDLRATLHDVVARFPAERVVLFDSGDEAREARALGSPREWDTALCDLIRHALIVNPADKMVEVRLRVHSAAVELSVADRGCGILPEDLEAVLEGPALSRVRDAVIPAGGELALASIPRQCGCCVRLWIPTCGVGHASNKKAA